MVVVAAGVAERKRGGGGGASNGTLTLDLVIVVQRSHEISWPGDWLFFTNWVCLVI